MIIHSSLVAIAISVAVMPGLAWAQHGGHQAGSNQTASAELTQCLRVQLVIQNIIAAATARAEAARLSNSPAELRAALDHLEAALRDIRVQSEPCSVAAASSDPHAGHGMPSPQSPSTAAPASGPAPHVGHTAPTPKSATGRGQDPNDEAAVEAWLKGYDAAFNAKDLDKLAAFYHPEVTIYEGGGVNNGWVDYRDRHLGPELKGFENLRFGHSNTEVTVLPGGQSAYATSEYSIKARIGEREIDSRGLETLVLVKGTDGNWKIRHSHTSSRPARRPPA